MKNLCYRAGVAYFRFHPVRHAVATFMEKIGIPISSIQGLLDHENRKTTKDYIHLLEGREPMLSKNIKMLRNNSNKQKLLIINQSLQCCIPK